MSYQPPARDISLRVVSASAAGEQRISPSWTVTQLKRKLETITGIPPSGQQVRLHGTSKQNGDVNVVDDDSVQISSWGLSSTSEIEVIDTRPPAFQHNFSLEDAANSAVPKYNMPVDTYETLPDSVLAWKKKQHLGRFDPAAPAVEAAKVRALWEAVRTREIEVEKRCQLGDDSTRRGVVKFVGEIAELPGLAGGAWVGVELDEPVGKNDGYAGESDQRRRVFECGPKRGVFVRPERVNVGEFPPLEMGIDDEEEMEEI